MGLFSFLHKNKQESAPENGEFHSRTEEESQAVRGRGKRKPNNQSNAPADPVLPEKKRARRRLVGAVALVLAAIIGLPMILDSEPKPLAEDIAIQIPSKDKPIQSGTIAPPASSSTSRVAASAALDQKEEIVEPSSTAPATPTVPAAAESASAKSSVPTTAIVAGAAAAAGAVALANNKPKDDAKHSETDKPASTDKAKPEPQPAAKTDNKAGNKVDNKADNKTETKAAASVEKTNDAARAKAILEGKPDPGKPDPKATEKPGKFVIQVAALATKEKINELQTKLKDAGIKSYTQKVATVSGERTRIRVGPFANKEEADKMRARIVKLGLNGTITPA